MPAGQNVVAAYNFNNVIVMLGGFRLGNFGEDGGVSFEYPSESVTHKVSADGRVSISKINDNRMIATVTLMQTSGSNRSLDAVWKTQNAAFAQGLPVIALPFSLTNPRTGDSVNTPGAVILQPPTPDQAMEAGEYEWQILLPYAKRDLILGVVNGLPGPATLQNVVNFPP